MDYGITIAPLDYQKAIEDDVRKRYRKLIEDLDVEYFYTASYFPMWVEIKLGRGCLDWKVEGSLIHEILHHVLVTQVGLYISAKLDDLVLSSPSNYKKTKELMSIDGRRLF